MIRTYCPGESSNPPATLPSLVDPAFVLLPPIGFWGGLVQPRDKIAAARDLCLRRQEKHPGSRPQVQHFKYSAITSSSSRNSLGSNCFCSIHLSSPAICQKRSQLAFHSNIDSNSCPCEITSSKTRSLKNVSAWSRRSCFFSSRFSRNAAKSLSRSCDVNIALSFETSIGK